MTNVNHTPVDFWDGALLQPQPTQDSDLLQQVGFIPGLKDILLLRQVHALEHATVWILSGARQSVLDHPGGRVDDDRLSGMSTEQGFYLYGEIKTGDLSRAVQQALQRITTGEWNLALHPRCGTNVSVGMLLTAGLTLGSLVLLPRGAIEQLFGMGMAALIATQLTPDVGQLAQQYLTTAIPFNLAVQEIVSTLDLDGRPAHFVKVRWIERSGVEMAR
jgi:Domain of unknown function (DUF6391)